MARVGQPSQAQAPVVCDATGPAQAQMIGPAWTSSGVAVNSLGAQLGVAGVQGMDPRKQVSSDVWRPR